MKQSEELFNLKSKVGKLKRKKEKNADDGSSNNSAGELEKVLKNFFVRSPNEYVGGVNCSASSAPRIEPCVEEQIAPQPLKKSSKKRAKPARSLSPPATRSRK